jgi:hypothetical protein
MLRLTTTLIICLIFSGCAGTENNLEASGPPNPYQGKYVGMAKTEGGTSWESATHEIKVYISQNGDIRVVDVEGISAYGKLEGNKLHLVRPIPTKYLTEVSRVIRFPVS